MSNQFKHTNIVRELKQRSNSVLCTPMSYSWGFTLEGEEIVTS